MKVLTDKKRVENLKHFQCSSQHYDMLLKLQYETPNLPLEVENSGFEKRFIPIHSLRLENQNDILILNGGDFCISK